MQRIGVAPPPWYYDRQIMRLHDHVAGMFKSPICYYLIPYPGVPEISSAHTVSPTAIAGSHIRQWTIRDLLGRDYHDELVLRDSDDKFPELFFGRAYRAVSYDTYFVSVWRMMHRSRLFYPAVPGAIVDQRRQNFVKFCDIPLCDRDVDMPHPHDFAIGLYADDEDTESGHDWQYLPESRLLFVNPRWWDDFMGNPHINPRWCPGDPGHDTNTDIFEWGTPHW